MVIEFSLGKIIATQREIVIKCCVSPWGRMQMVNKIG
ncbi:phosphotransferase system IIA component [Vibrio parahaemolyticus]|nr:phosphotransferase system IIA component [Vibrio parahaemolyticus]